MATRMTPDKYGEHFAEGETKVACVVFLLLIIIVV
jgi:hypothetical protein